LFGGRGFRPGLFQVDRRGAVLGFFRWQRLADAAGEGENEE
jgi:hypothetical protein